MKGKIMKISMDKQYRTRDGRKVRIYATDHFGYYPIVGAVLCGENWVTVNWRADGVASPTDNSLDLIEVKPRIQIEYWINVYKTKKSDIVVGQIFFTRELADKYVVYPDRIACVKGYIDCEEGDGL
jgi:hypothetical protein